MSASYAVDLGNTTYSMPSVLAGPAFPASGAIIGNTLDMINANSFTNLTIVGGCANLSGQLRVQVVTGDNPSSLNQNPVSGLAALPGVFESGGIVRLNSGGLLGGTFGLPVSGQSIVAGSGGFQVFAGFQRPHRYIACVVLSGDFFTGSLTVGFTAQLKTTGSGGGFTLSPASGVVNV